MLTNKLLPVLVELAVIRQATFDDIYGVICAWLQHWQALAVGAEGHLHISFDTRCSWRHL